MHTNTDNTFRSERVYFTHAGAPDERVCFIVFGGATNCNTVNPKEMGKRGARLLIKSVPLSPLCLEWQRAFNFFAHLLGFDLMHLTAWNGSVDFSTHAMKPEGMFTRLLLLRI